MIALKLSDHQPILTSISYSATQRNVSNMAKPSPAWHKATFNQLNTYLTYVDNFLDNALLKDPENSNDIDNFNTILTDGMLN